MSSPSDRGPQLIPADALATPAPQRPGMRSRWIVAPAADGWTGFALSEWELRAAGWHDRHPHDELNLVLEGELHVESEGRTVVAGPGDAVRVRAGHDGRYWAPGHARMVSVYGDNAAGAASDVLGYWDVERDG